METKRSCNCDVMTLAVSVETDGNGVAVKEISAKHCAECGAPILYAEKAQEVRE